MDQKVLEVQRWLNNAYSNNTDYESIFPNGIYEDGMTGNQVVTALIVALQIELGAASVDGDFGPGTKSAFNAYFPNKFCARNEPYSLAGPTTNLEYILQGGFWCKGYDCWNFSGRFYIETENAVKEFQNDIGYSVDECDGKVDAEIMKALLNTDPFVLAENGDAKIREIQQKLNVMYKEYSGFMPTNGVYGRETNEALIYALQAEEGMDSDTANGYFGNGTTSLCPTLTMWDSRHEFVWIVQAALYCNGFDPGDIDGYYGGQVEQAVSDFQSFMALPVTGVANMPTIKALLASCGDTSRTAKACDCATILTPAKAMTLKNANYEVVGRYLTGVVASGASKALTRSEMNVIFNAGLRFFPIFQTSGDSINYFKYSQGIEDAYEAISSARKLGIPEQSVIYFAVDFDAMDYQVTENIIPYFTGVEEIMSRLSLYRMGVYGARNICTRVSEECGAVYSFVGDMSTGYSGNLGYKMPTNWAFDQFVTISVGHGEGLIEIDKDGYSGRDSGVSYMVDSVNNDLAVLGNIDRSHLKNSYYYAEDYNLNRKRENFSLLGSDVSDLTFLNILQALYAYFYEHEDYEKTDTLWDEMIRLRKLNPAYITVYSDFLDEEGNFALNYDYYAEGRKTMKIHYDSADYFVEQDIITMNQNDERLLALASLIPGVPVLQALMYAVHEQQQNPKEPLENLLLQGTLDGFLGSAYEKMLAKYLNNEEVAAAILSYADFTLGMYDAEMNDSVVHITEYEGKDIILKEGDAVVQVRLLSDMGGEQYYLVIYMRNNYPYAINTEALKIYHDRIDTGTHWLGYRSFVDEGYVPSEIHLTRGDRWDDVFG